jgi:hypothetical protein
LHVLQIKFISILNASGADLNEKPRGELENYDKKKSAAVGIVGGVLIKKNRWCFKNQ